MNPAVPPDQSTAKAVSDVIEFGGKAAVSLASAWGFLALIAKPYLTWRKARQVAIVSEALAPHMAEIVSRERQIFEELDTLIDLATDNRDRLDEINGLMDGVGLASRDRRSSPEDEARFETMIEVLVERRRDRKRNLPERPRAD